MASRNDIDFDLLMQEQGVDRLDSRDGSRSGRHEHLAGPAGSRSPRQASEADTSPPSPPPPDASRLALARTRTERDEAREALAEAEAARQELTAALRTTRDELEATRAARTQAEADRDDARATVATARAECSALTKERAALQRQIASPPAPVVVTPRPSLRKVLAERGAADENEAVELLLAVLGHTPADLLDGLHGSPQLVEQLYTHLARVCERPECQPGDPAVVVRVPRERCDVCGGSDIRAAWECLQRACRLAGVTRLVIVGGSPPYRTQLRELCRGTDLKLDLVSGRSKPGRKRARNSAERVVIWGSTILDHGTSAAYEHLGDRLIQVNHRGISGMLQEVARALSPETSPR